MPEIIGTPANDTLTGTDGADVIRGLGGDDVIDGILGADSLFGDDGDDTFTFSAVLSTNVPLPRGSISGGAGRDTVDATRVSPVAITPTGVGAAATVQLRVGSQVYDVTGVEAFNTGIGNDQVSLYGIEGPGFTILTGAGNDFIQHSAGIDTIRAGTGNDTVYVGVEDQSFGDAGDDRISVDPSFWTNRNVRGAINGGDGTDTLATGLYATVDLAANTLSFAVGANAYGSASVTGIENVEISLYSGYSASAYGDDGANRLTATAFQDDYLTTVLDGRGGNDVIIGAQGRDDLRGGAGDDVITGGLGQDRIDGGEGSDTAVFNLAATVDLRLGAQDTGSGIDTLISIENLMGSNFADRLTGNTAANQLEGGAGDDILDGRAGNDRLLGGSGNDTLTGGVGDDYLLGGDGHDVIAGGLGSDTLDGGSGNDLLILTGTIASLSVWRSAGGFIVARDGERDFVTGIEQVSIGGRTMTLAQLEREAFDPYSYLSANPDIHAAFGSDIQAATSHYFSTGMNEGRSTGSFDALAYIASYADLRRAFGADARAGFEHYMIAGRAEGRTVSFNPLDYLAVNPDVARAFGLNEAAATSHFITNGSSEGRGQFFDADLYAASNADLAVAFGSDDYASTLHYILAGWREGRPTSGFNAISYQTTNPDLAGLSREQALDHWLSFGADEGRTVNRASGAIASDHAPVSTSASISWDGDDLALSRGGETDTDAWMF